MPALLKKASQGKACYFGVEVTDGITWQGWEPGREYTKNIVLQNVKVKTQKLKYKVPSSRFFTTLYPQPIVLSAGTSFTLPITFRPLEKTTYNDQIQFTTSEGDFSVPIKAVLPQYGLESPDRLYFDMCAAQDYVQQTFTIKNVSELVTPFVVDCEDPFSVEPRDGVMEPFSTLTLTATFKPKAALVYEANAVIKYGNDLSYATVTMLEGIGKYPHLLVSGGMVSSKVSPDNQQCIHFGQVPIGKTVEKWVEVQNLSPVNAPYTIEHPTGLTRIDTVFDCKGKCGIVPAQGSVRIPITFSPNTIDTTSIDYFYIKAIGNISQTVIKCSGISKGPRVHLSQSVVNFYQINEGQTATQTVDIVNDSDVEATYQFGIDCYESVFKFDQLSGVLPGNSKRTIILQFCPQHPINYYRKVPCLVHNQDPLFVELLGTCHTETCKPAVLQARHLHKYRVHQDRGLSFTPPDLLNEMVREKKLKVDKSGCLYDPQKADSMTTEVPCQQPMDEFFNDGYYSDTVAHQPHVSMDIHQADFGRVVSIQDIEQQTVTLTNHTQGKISVVWTGDENNVFTVTPSEMDIPPLKSCAFRVTFRPNAPNQFFGAELECYAYYKSLRDYRLTEGNTHFPPWCLNLVATGQTFQPHMETFLPRYHLDSHKVVFPAVNANEATYRTVLLSNTGTTPILYDFDKDDTGIYSMKPTKGLIEPQHHQVFTVKVLPQEVKTYKHTLTLNLNDADKNKQELQAWGSAESPDVYLENSGELYFKPTCVGTQSTRVYQVTNQSRIPLLYEWKMANRDAQQLEVVQESGLLLPNESQFHTWMFGPQSQDKFVMKPSLIVWGQGQSSTSSGGKKKKFEIRAVGEGSIGEITADTSYVDFGTVIVGSSATKHVILVNHSDCSLHYRLHLEQRIEGPYAEEYTRYDVMGLELEKSRGIIPARSRHVISMTVRPARRVYYQWSLAYTLQTSAGNAWTEDGDVPTPVEEKTHLCHVLATGVFPTMAVTDARCYGSAIGISKKQLWTLFSLDNLNICLDSDPSAAELMYDVATRHSHNRRPPVYTRAIMDFNFSAAPVGAEPCVVQLMVENTGAVPCQWAMLLPSDLQIELEYWAETGEFDEDELHEMKVMDNKLFSIEPSSGKLGPGETRTVTMTYNHLMPGTDRLPVLLKLARGREILLNFVGVTVDPERPYIHFPSNKHMFAPVPIGDQYSPKQIYELYNGGSVPVTYEIDLTSLQILTEENFDQPVFECMNPRGEVLPGQTTLLEWKFCPLESKTYMADVPIHIHNGDTAVITFTGVGFDKRVMGDTMPLSDTHHELAGVPSVQSVTIPGQLCFLSQERVSFNNVPLYSKSRRLSMLTNRSPDHPVAFTWHVTNPRDANMVTISPSCGRLEPGEGQICRVTFMAVGSPSFYDIDLICEITNLTHYDDYKTQLTAWHTEKQRQQVEFTVTEHDIDADLRVTQVEERPPSSRLKSIDGVKSPSPDLVVDPDAEFIKYKTLPPIKQCLIDTLSQQERGKRRFRDHFWAVPEPPKPFLLHLGLTARSHTIGEFQENFPQDVKNFYVDRALSERQAGTKNEDTTFVAKPVTCVNTEADVVAAALSNIIRSLLNDTEFHDSCEKVVSADTPYYPQIVEQELPREEATPTPGIRLDTPLDSIHSPGAESPNILVLDTTGGDSPVVSQRNSPVVTGRDSQRLDRTGGETPVTGRTGGSPVARSRGETPVSQRDSQRSMSETGVTPSRPLASTPKGPSKELQEMSLATQQEDFTVKQAVKKLPEFGTLVEGLVENSLVNILQEAFSQEFNITSRPRLVALPPKQRTPRSRGGSAK